MGGGAGPGSGWGNGSGLVMGRPYPGQTRSMADTPVPDADPADVEEQHRPVVDAPTSPPVDLPAVPDADPADVDEQAQVVADDEDDRR